MYAPRHALKQFLVRLERRGEDQFLVAAEAADQPVARFERADRTRVDIVHRHAGAGPDLPRNVPRLLRPRLDIAHARELAVEKDEALGQVIVDVLAAVVKARERAEADARLRPVGGR